MPARRVSKPRTPYRVRAMHDTYFEIKDKLDTVPMWLLKWGLGPAEIASEAFLAFLHAYERFDPKRGKRFKDYASETVFFLARARVRDELRKQRKHERGKIKDGKTVSGILAATACPDLTIDEFGEKLEKLSPDGKYLVKLVIDAPKFLQRIVKAAQDHYMQTVGRESMDRTAWRASITKFLTKQGWSDDRIKRAFKDVAHAIGGKK